MRRLERIAISFRTERSLALGGQFFAMTDHDRTLQRVGKVTTGETGGIHTAGKNGRYAGASPPFEVGLLPVRSVVKGRMAASTQRSDSEDLTPVVLGRASFDSKRPAAGRSVQSDVGVQRLRRRFDKSSFPGRYAWNHEVD
jgi:hypothetical protein